MQITRHAAAGRPVLRICGGLQTLARVLHDPDGADGQAGGPVPGLGLLALETRYAPPKRVNAQQARFSVCDGEWRSLDAVSADGYEIRTGMTAPQRKCTSAGTTRDALVDAQGGVLGWQRGSVPGVYMHGLFESAAAMQALFGRTERNLDDNLDRRRLGRRTLRIRPVA